MKAYIKYLLLVLGSAILAFGIYNIHSISSVTEGGVLGATLLIEHWLKISPSITSVILTALCYILGFKYLGKKFILYSAVSAGSFSLFYFIFEQFPRVIKGIENTPFIAAILGAVFVGLGVGICVKMGGAPTGDDALAMAFSKKYGKNIEIMYLITDISVLGLSLTYIPVSKLWYSFLTVILSGQIIGLIQKIRIK